MTEKTKILAEVRTLIDQQIETLRGELLTPVEITQYAERQQRIKELVTQMCQHHFDAN